MFNFAEKTKRRGQKIDHAFFNTTFFDLRADYVATVSNCVHFNVPAFAWGGIIKEPVQALDFVQWEVLQL